MSERIDAALADIAAGKFIIIVDDADENSSGDLVMAAEYVTPDAINFMMTRARGTLGVALTRQRLEELEIPPMTPGQVGNRLWQQRSRGPAFAVAVDAVAGMTSGDTAVDRARTVRALVNDEMRPEDFARPGHTLPIASADGGTLVRVGHTEATVDIARLAGLRPAGVLCRILNDDGTMADKAALEQFALEHDMKIVTIASIIRLRRHTEKLIEKTAEAHLPTMYGDFEAIIYTSKLNGAAYFAIVKGDPASCEAPLVRVHSGCVTGDILGSLKCDCGWQLHRALELIEENGCGVVLYIQEHEGRGIGLANKIKAYHLQEQGYDTVEANVALGFAPDLRDYGIGAQVLVDLGITRMRLMSNNPAKFTGLEGYGLELVERVPLEAPTNPYSEKYLQVKRDKMGHLLKNSPSCPCCSPHNKPMHD